MSANNLRFFDFEVYPEWWCCVVSDEEDNYPGGLYKNEFDKETENKIKDKMRVYSSDEDLMIVKDKLKVEFYTNVLTGYNIKRYDLMIAKCIFAGFTPRKLYIASELLIHPEYATKDAEYMRVYDFIKFGFAAPEGFQDLLDDSDKSLKDKECSLGMDIRETTVPFNKINLTNIDKENIIFYCKHDVYALHVYYWVVSKSYIDTKIKLCEIFELPYKTGYTNTNAVLSGKVLEAKRAHNTTIIDPTITIRNKELNEYFKKYIPPEVYKQLLVSQESANYNIFENKVVIGDGGLHSVLALPRIDRKLPALYVESTKDWTMFNIDASSCYTSVMLYVDAMSRGITNHKRLKDIYERRMKLKATPKSQWTQDDNNFVAAGKVVLNTVYGAMGNKYLTLYDDYMRSKTCRVGQMILIALGNSLYTNIPDLKVIQTNTDGILVYLRRKDSELLQSLVNEFSSISNFIFEIEEDYKLWQLNVNNYIAISSDNSLKNKGGTFVTTVYQKGVNKIRPLSNHCIAKAQIEYYTKNNNPVKYLVDNTIVSDMCLTCTKGPTYSNMIHYYNNEIIELGKVARVIAITDEKYGVVKKRGIQKNKRASNYGELKEDLVSNCPPHALIVNDALYNYKIENRKLKHIDGREWDIDYNYYAKLLDSAMNIHWYKLKGTELKYTKELNL